MAIDTKPLTDLITEFCALQSKDAVSPEGVGYILLRIVDLLLSAGMFQSYAITGLTVHSKIAPPGNIVQ